MRILIIEDDANHMAEAVAAVEAAGHTAVKASDMSEAEKFISEWDDKWGVDAVISDVYFPLDQMVKPWVGDKGQNYSDPQPIGVAVALRCEARKVPFVLCTDGYHHGNALEWISCLAKERRWIMIDASPETGGDYDLAYTASADHKDWQKAVEEVTKAS